jgi:FkbM family methyltransferase
MTAVGRLARIPLSYVPNDAVVPILLGPNRGQRWVVGSSVHSCWLGTYERRTQAAIVSNLRRGDCAYDIGANAGFFTLLMSRIVGYTGQVHAFEPLPENVAALRRHIELNRIENVVVHPVALSDHTGVASFERGGHKSMGRLSKQGDIAVKCAALDDLGLFAPALIKMDIEGEESVALGGMAKTLKAGRPYLLIEGHAPRR